MLYRYKILKNIRLKLFIIVDFYKVIFGWYLFVWLGFVYVFGVWIGGVVKVVFFGLLVVLVFWVLFSLGVDIIGGEGGNMGLLGEGKEKLFSGGNVWGFIFVIG